MNLFNETKIRLARFGLGTNQFIQIAVKNIPRLFVRLFISLIPIIFVSLQVALFFKLQNENWNDSSPPVALILISFPLLPIYVSLISKTNVIDELFTYQENVIKTRIATESFAIYEASNTKVKKTIQMVSSSFFKAIFVGIPIPALFPLFYIVFGFPSPDYWFTPYGIEKFSTVLSETPIGFIFVVLTDLLPPIAYLAINESFTIIYVTVSTNIESIADDISLIVTRLNETIAHKISIKEEIKLIVHLQLHSYKILEMLEDIIRAPIFYQISLYALQSGLLLYLIETNMTTATINAGVFLSGILLITLFNYTLCYFTTILTLDVMSICERIYNLHWYQLSYREQIFIQLIIQRAQKPFEIKGLGIFVCSLETFLKMLQKAVSYYMIFRKLQ